MNSKINPYAQVPPKPTKETKAILKKFHALYPSVKSYHKWVSKSINQNKSVLKPILFACILGCLSVILYLYLLGRLEVLLRSL